MSKITLLLRQFLYALFATLDSITGWLGIHKASVIILCYHSIAPDDWRFSVSQENFKKQIEWLIKRRFQFLTLQDINAIVSGTLSIKKPSVAITFDDGYKDILTVKDWLYEKRIFPVAFVLSDADRATKSEIASGKEFLSIEDIHRLRDAGWEIGCHSATHADFVILSENDIQYEVADAKRILESEVGKPITSFAYPKGYYSPMIVDAVCKAGYMMAFSMDDGTLKSGSNPLTLPRIGVDHLHTLDDFCGMITWPAVLFRMAVKNILTPGVINRILGIKTTEK